MHRSFAAKGRPSHIAPKEVKNSRWPGPFQWQHSLDNLGVGASNDALAYSGDRVLCPHPLAGGVHGKAGVTRPITQNYGVDKGEDKCR